MHNDKSRVLLFFALAFVAAGLVAIGARLWQEPQRRPVLRVLTYSSFFGPFGPGGEIRSGFEASCDCRLEWLNAGSGLILSYEAGGGWTHSPDVVLGLNAFEVERADSPEKWTSLASDVEFVEGVREAIRERFLPYDYSPITWITRDARLAAAKSWSEFLEITPPRALSLPDPRTSSLGMEFLSWWFRSLDVNSGEYLEPFRKARHSFAPSWESSYGLFQSGVTKASLSYLTSLAFHWFEGKDFDVKAVSFESGHPLSVEFVGVSATTTEKDLAKAFVMYLLKDDVQALIARRNYMLPVARSAHLPEGWERLPKLKLIPFSFVSIEEQDQHLQKFRAWP